jgi:hypothetical protein
VAKAQLASVAIPTEIMSDRKSAPELKYETKARMGAPPKIIIYEASGATLAAFAVDFGDLPVDQWSLSDNFEVASFTQDGRSKSAYYDFDNNLVATTTEVHFSDLPVSAKDHIARKYAAYKVTDVLYFDDNEANETDLILYGQQFQDEDSYFVELENPSEKIVLHVSLNGDVSFFKRISG